jgi:hypothetical protein
MGRENRSNENLVPFMGRENCLSGNVVRFMGSSLSIFSHSWDREPARFFHSMLGVRSSMFDVSGSVKTSNIQHRVPDIAGSREGLYPLAETLPELMNLG